MVFIAVGKVMSLAMFVIFFVLLLIFYYMAKQGRGFEIRKRIAGLDAIPEAVGRATEMGRSIHGATGGSTTASYRGPQVVAGLAILGYTAELAAKKGTRVYISPREADQVVLSGEVLRLACTRAGRPDLYRPDQALFWGNMDGSYIAGIWGFIEREKPAAQLLVGGWGAEALLIAEEGKRRKLLQIAGCMMPSQLPFFALTCDYVMIADELYVAGCVATGDKVDMSLIVAEDIMKIGLMAMALIGTILMTFGSNALVNILTF